MNEEEKQVIKRLKDDIGLVTFNGNLNYGVGNLYTNINDLKILLNLISKLQKENSELTNELKHISKLFGENTKRLETISRKLGLTKKNEYGFLYDEIIKEIDKLQKELDKKDKVIDLLYEDIECEYSGTSYLKSLEEYYMKVEEENENR